MSLQPYLNVLQEFEEKISELDLRPNYILQDAENGIRLSAFYLLKLRDLVTETNFENRQEEITFFKEIKPKIFSVFLFYHEVQTLESSRPLGTTKNIKQFLNNRSRFLVDFFQKNEVFYKYYRCKAQYYDEQHFVRCNIDPRSYNSHPYSMVDNEFSTSHDYLLAEFMAYEKLLEYIGNELIKVKDVEKDDMKDHINEESALYNSDYFWTETKIAYVELVYALQGTGAINNGNVDIKDLAGYMGKAFNIDVEDVYRTFIEIKTRKKESTVFIEKLKEALLRRISDSFK